MVASKVEFLSPKLVTNFVNLIKSNIVIDDSHSFKKIYLKRSSFRRDCKNLLEVENLIIKDFGFDAVELEKYSFRQQVSILSHCDFVVGPTGAAWTNIIFCDPRKQVKAVCWGVSKKLNNYWSDLGMSSNVQITHMYAGNYKNFEVDCESLSKLLYNMFVQNDPQLSIHNKIETLD